MHHNHITITNYFKIYNKIYQYFFHDFAHYIEIFDLVNYYKNFSTFKWNNIFGWYWLITTQINLMLIPIIMLTTITPNELVPVMWQPSVMSPPRHGWGWVSGSRTFQGDVASICHRHFGTWGLGDSGGFGLQGVWKEI